MERDIRFDQDGSFEDFAKVMENAMKQYPASAEKVLKKEARNVAKDLKSRVNTEAKGHHYGGSESPLADSFRKGKVVKSGKKMTAAVTSKALHYHLYEEGHAMITHKRKNKKGKSKQGSMRQVGTVAGKKTVAHYMAQRSDYAELIGQELLNEILKEAGLDS